ncbi:MAG: outer membrane lipoprotein-sorting protein [Alphaproteobacteria bacterium]|nr:MAG: outer membrane lipoprotein-sorting protein [Alphaproteobacteria bacterium]
MRNHKWHKSILTTSAALSVILFSISAKAGSESEFDTSQISGFEIAAKSDRSDRGFGSSEVEVRMILKNAAGKETERRLLLSTYEVPSEEIGDKTLVKFTEPKDIRDTALLSFAHILEPDHQWLFLPSVKRVKRISTANKSGPFVGSEFSFEDMTGQELNKYDYKQLESAACGEFQCFRLERTPRYEGSAYSSQIAWVDSEHYQIRKVEYFDRKGDPLKVLRYEDFKLYHGKFWRPHSMKMENLQTGKSTELVFDQFNFDRGLDEKDFTKSSLAQS